MRLNIAVPEAEVTKPVLDAALESVTRLNEQLISTGGVPTFDAAVDQVRWKPEPPGAEHFDHAAQVLKRGWGDCDDLAPWHAASLRATGEDRGAHAVVRKSGPKRWHAVVQRSDGSIDDPSLDAGMPGPKGTRAPVLPTMGELVGSTVSGDLIAMPQIAVRPVFEGGQIVGFDARVDIPWHHSPADFREDVALSALRRAPVADQAVVGALRGGLRIAGISGLVSDDVMDRAEAIADCIEGADFDDLADEYGEEHAERAVHLVGDFFDTLADVASKAVSFVPGIGPIASTAIDLAHQGLHAIHSANVPAKTKKAALKYHKHLKHGGPPARKMKGTRGASSPATTFPRSDSTSRGGAELTVKTARGTVYSFAP